MQQRVGRIALALVIMFVAPVASLPAPSVTYAGGRVYVRGYLRRDGTYVSPHYRTAPDGNPYNNYSFPGNYNPNTGEITPGNPATYLERYYNRGSGGWSIPAPLPQGSRPAHVPANAWVSGSRWYCNSGYKQVGDGCEAIDSVGGSLGYLINKVR